MQRLRITKPPFVKMGSLPLVVKGHTAEGLGYPMPYQCRLKQKKSGCPCEQPEVEQGGVNDAGPEGPAQLVRRDRTSRDNFEDTTRALKIG